MSDNNPLAPSQDQASTAAAQETKMLLRKMVAIVRIQMRDHAKLNRIIRGEETSDRRIGAAVMLTVDDYSNTPPLLGRYTLGQYPGGVDLLVRGTIIRILGSVGLLQLRNHMAYTDGKGVYVGISDKAPALQQWMRIYQGSYESDKRRQKMALNLESGFNNSSVQSEYALITGIYDYGGNLL